MKVDLKRLVMYAGASGDFNEIHFDFEKAKGAGFERPILHGMLTFALAIKEFREKENVKPQEIKRVSARFKAPILEGEKISFKIEKSDDGSKFRVICVGEDGTERAECEIEVRRK